MAAGSESVRVIVRCRPMNTREKQLNSKVKQKAHIIETLHVTPRTARVNLIEPPPPHLLGCVTNEHLKANAHYSFLSLSLPIHMKL